MNNKGQITVFISLITTVLLILSITAIKLCRYFTAKEKAAITAELAVSDVKSKYNSYIFEHYHILLFDKTDYGKGEAYMEEFFNESLKNNLQDSYEVRETAINSYNLITDNEFYALKKQIEDYTVYAAIDYGADKIIDKTGGKESGVEDLVIEEMDKEKEEGEKGQRSEAVSAGDEDDPRKFVKSVNKIGIVNFLAPDDLDISMDVIDLSECPSGSSTYLVDNFEINSSFKSYSRLKSDLKKKTSWNESLYDAGCGLAYSKEMFNSAVNQDKNASTVFAFEMEYLICGSRTDYDNLNKTVKRIIAIRFPINYSYLLKDTVKMARVKEIAFSLSLVTAIPEPVLKYLIAGCWAYIEAMADTRALLAGKKVKFEKSSLNWRTDIDSISDSFFGEPQDDENGMTYEDYLLILLSLNMDKAYMRMLDIIQLNTRQYYPDFKMCNAAVGMTADISVDFEGNTFGFDISGGY